MGQRGISVIIITKNEEINIGRCIQSVQQVADEVIVIDTFSTDKTTKIATELGAQVVSKEWLGYGPQKNFGNNLAQYEYILALDADEALDETLSSEILKLKNQNQLNGVYELNRMTNYCGKFIKHSGWYPDRKIRLFPKKEAHWDDSPVHEKLIPHKGQGISQIPGHLLHYSFYSISEHWERINKYSDIEAEIIR
jgi:glycosyltransferase involved in cell wall biosynthesis